MKKSFQKYLPCRHGNESVDGTWKYFFEEKTCKSLYPYI